MSSISDLQTLLTIAGGTLGVISIPVTFFWNRLQEIRKMIAEADQRLHLLETEYAVGRQIQQQLCTNLESLKEVIVNLDGTIREVQIDQAKNHKKDD